MRLAGTRATVERITRQSRVVVRCDDDAYGTRTIRQGMAGRVLVDGAWQLADDVRKARHGGQ
jgi:hypothetical protein